MPRAAFASTSELRDALSVRGDKNYAMRCRKKQRDALSVRTRYARSVVEAERTMPQVRDRRVVFFGIKNPDDRVTEHTADRLIRPLVDELVSEVETWEFQLLIGAEASKSALTQVLVLETCN